jgi:hypothetical protein
MPYKNPKELQCVICDKTFERRVSPKQIKMGRGISCSRECLNIILGLKNLRGKNRICEKCGKTYYCKKSDDKNGYVRKFCSIECAGKTKMGRKISIDGYWVVHIPKERGSWKNEMKEHRWIMEQYLGRRLKSTEIVHHINFDK